MRHTLLLAMLVATLAVPSSSAAGPAFVPSPRQAFEGFTAINAPRADVPIGALWIDGYGPTGDAAAPDNLETVRSLNGVTIDKGLQLALTAGLFNLLGIEPRLRDKYTARFTDLTIVRVKDVAKLSGPKGEPRIVAALKAASVTVSTEGEIGLNARTIGWNQREIEGSTANGRTRNYAIEGRDLFVAVRVATPKLVTGPIQLLEIAGNEGAQARARLEDYLIVMQPVRCASAKETECGPASFGVAKLNSYPPSAPAEQVPASAEGETRLPLPVPIADEKGGLYDAVMVRWVASCSVRRSEGCRKEPRLQARLVGSRLEDLGKLNASGWASH